MKYIIITKRHIRNFSIFFFIIMVFTLIFLLSTHTPDGFASSDEEETNISRKAKEEIQNIYKQEEKIAYLTFDDGPTRKATPKILDILDKLNVKANFFVVGKHVEENPDLIRREWESGHFIANHTYSHNNKKIYASTDTFLKEIQDTDKAIAKALNRDSYCSHLFRFPNGSKSKNYSSAKKQAIQSLGSIGYTYIDWNCLNNDSVKKYSKTQLLNNLRKSSSHKTTLVVLMHDTNDVNPTDAILEDSILYLQKQGYTFHTFYDFFPETT